MTTLEELQQLADELNADNPIDWNDDRQTKYSLEYQTGDKYVYLSGTKYGKKMNTPECTSKTFLFEAEKRMGKTKLLELFGVKVEPKVGQLCYFSCQCEPIIGELGGIIVKDNKKTYKIVNTERVYWNCQPLTKEEIQQFIDKVE